MHQVVDTAPSFSLKNQDGELVSLEDFREKWVILYFYPKDDTPGCTTEACDFSKLAEDVVVLGVSPDTVASHQKFIAKYDLKLTLLSDPEKVVMKQYGAWGLKKNYGREYEGVIRSTFLIDPSGGLIKAWRNVRAKGHAQRVLNEGLHHPSQSDFSSAFSK